MAENPEPEQDITPEPQKENTQVPNQGANIDAVNLSLSLINEKLDGAMRDISRLKEKQDTVGHEVDILQTQVGKSKKWYSDTPVLVSTLALLLSAVATLYPIFKEKSLTEEAYKNRAKEIVKRLTEIESEIQANGGIYGNMFSATQPEASNLVDEAISISDIDPKYINDAGYVVIINQAYRLSKTERLKDLLWRAWDIADDEATKFSLKNSEANYYFAIKKDSIMGRNSIRDAIRVMENQEISDDLKRVNIAQQYLNWCDFEFKNNNYNFAEQLLEKAEELIVKRSDDWKYKSYATYSNALYWRSIFDSARVKTPQYFR